MFCENLIYLISYVYSTSSTPINVTKNILHKRFESENCYLKNEPVSIQEIHSQYISDKQFYSFEWNVSGIEKHVGAKHIYFSAQLYFNGPVFIFEISMAS